MLQSKINAGGSDDPHTEINAMRHMQEHAAAIHNHTIHDNSTIDEMRNRATPKSCPLSCLTVMEDK